MSTVDAVLSRLSHVRAHGTGKWLARCPGHNDKNPSLSIAEGERGLLVKCWAGCTLHEITAAIGIHVADLFFKTMDTHTAYQSRIQRTQERQRQTLHSAVDGFSVDALREGDYFIRSRQGLDISTWPPKHLHDELNTLADAYALLAMEGLVDVLQD